MNASVWPSRSVVSRTRTTRAVPATSTQDPPVTRVAGGVWVEARNKGAWTFLHVADDSPPLTLLEAYPETEPGSYRGQTAEAT